MDGQRTRLAEYFEQLLYGRPAAIICGLYVVLIAVWYSGTIPPDRKRVLVVPVGKGDHQTCINYHGITLLGVPGKALAQLMLMQVCNQLCLGSHLVSQQQLTVSQCFAYWWSTDENFSRGCLQPMSVSRKYLRSTRRQSR